MIDLEENKITTLLQALINRFKRRLNSNVSDNYNLYKKMIYISDRWYK